MIMDYRSRKQLKTLKNLPGFFRLKNPARAGKRVGPRVSTHANPDSNGFNFLIFLEIMILMSMINYIQRHLRGDMSVLDIVFVGQCEMFALIFWPFFSSLFSWPRSS